MITWPDLTFWPINLWTAPRLAVQPESIKKRQHQSRQHAGQG